MHSLGHVVLRRPLVEGVGGSMGHLRHRYAHSRSLDDGPMVDDFLKSETALVGEPLASSGIVP